jgi:hypothetical protein
MTALIVVAVVIWTVVWFLVGMGFGMRESSLDQEETAKMLEARDKLRDKNGGW